jgi:hypothetical protein
MVEHLPSKLRALDSNPSTKNKNKQTNKKPVSTTLVFLIVKNILKILKIPVK